MLYAPYEKSRHARLAQLCEVLQAAPESLLEVANRFLELEVIRSELDGAKAIAAGTAPRLSIFTFSGTVFPQHAVQGLDVSIRVPYGSVTISDDSLTIKLLVEWLDLGTVIETAREEATVLLAAQAAFSSVPLWVRLERWREDPQDDRPISEGAITLSKPPFKSIRSEDFVQGSEIVPIMIQERALALSIADYHRALTSQIEDVPIFAARAVESIENYFGGRQAFFSALRIRGKRLDILSRIANASSEGYHTRHAAKKRRRRVTDRERQDCLEITQEVILTFAEFLKRGNLSNRPVGDGFRGILVAREADD